MYWVHDGRIYTTQKENWEEISKNNSHEIFKWEKPWVVHIPKWNQEFYLCALGYHGRGNKLKANLQNIRSKKYCWVCAEDMERVVGVELVLVNQSAFGNLELSDEFLKTFPKFRREGVYEFPQIFADYDLRADQDFIACLLKFGFHDAFRKGMPALLEVEGGQYYIFDACGQGEYLVTPETIKWRKIHESN